LVWNVGLQEEKELSFLHTTLIPVNLQIVGSPSGRNNVGFTVIVQVSYFQVFAGHK
jgi:hypothetical protein